MAMPPAEPALSSVWTSWWKSAETVNLPPPVNVAPFSTAARVSLEFKTWIAAEARSGVHVGGAADVRGRVVGDDVQGQGAGDADLAAVAAGAGLRAGADVVLGEAVVVTVRWAGGEAQAVALRNPAAAVPPVNARRRLR